MKRKHFGVLIVLCVGLLMVLMLSEVPRLWGQDGDSGGASGGSGAFLYFELELSGGVTADYDECLGLGSRNEIQESTVTGEMAVTTKGKTPGMLEWCNITLKRTYGGPSGLDIWSWRKALEDGKTEEATRDGAIILFSTQSSEPIARWEFHKGWVANLTLDGSVETLTIVHAGLERVAPFGPDQANR